MYHTRLLALLVVTVFLPSPRAPGQAPEPARRYALLVGVRSYDKTELHNLKYTENDVNALASVLRDAGYRRVVHMTQTVGAETAALLPTAANIRNQLRGILEDRDKRDTVLLAFSGHGVQFQGEQENYFCPMDAKLADRTSLVSLTEVYDDLKKSAAGVKVLLVDACRDDPRTNLSRSLSQVKLASVTRPQAVRPPGGVAALFSASEGQRSWDDDALQHGIFFHFVIQGLKGKAAGKGGSIDLVDVFRYVRDEVPDYVKEHIGPRERQVPHLIGDVSEKVPLLTLSADAPTRVEDLDGGVKLETVLIPAGTFAMGDDKGLHEEKPQHAVRITRPFYLGKHEVTVGQFRRFVQDQGYKTEAEADGKGGYGYNAARGQFEGYKPEYTWRNPGFPQGDDHPVVNVTWNDAVAFCDWVSSKAGRKYRLPTEAEWEYSARAHTTKRWYSGEDIERVPTVANVADASYKRMVPEADWVHTWDDTYPFTAPVNARQFQPNALGLHHMHGNVWEWCADWYATVYYRGGETEDPQGPPAGLPRVRRGGSFSFDATLSRSAHRNSFVPGNRYYDMGFRVACVQ